VLAGMVARLGIGQIMHAQRRLKPTPATASALKRTETECPTRFNGFPIPDTELIWQTLWPVKNLRPEQPLNPREDLRCAGGDSGAIGAMRVREE